MNPLLAFNIVLIILINTSLLSSQTGLDSNKTKLPPEIANLFLKPIDIENGEVSFVMKERFKMTDEGFNDIKAISVRMSENDEYRLDWIVSKDIGKKHFLPNPDKQLYLYDESGPIGTMTINDILCTTIGMNREARARCSVQLYSNITILDEESSNNNNYYVSTVNMETPFLITHIRLHKIGI
jgi:hypothetical protein